MKNALLLALCLVGGYVHSSSTIVRYESNNIEMRSDDSVKHQRYIFKTMAVSGMNPTIFIFYHLPEIIVAAVPAGTIDTLRKLPFVRIKEEFCQVARDYCPEGREDQLQAQLEKIGFYSTAGFWFED